MTFKSFAAEAFRQIIKWVGNLIHVVSLGIVRIWKIPAVQKALTTWGAKAIEIADDFAQKKLDELKEKVSDKKN